MLDEPCAGIAELFGQPDLIAIFVIAQRGFCYDFTRHGLRAAKQSKLHLRILPVVRRHGVGNDPGPIPVRKP